MTFSDAIAGKFIIFASGDAPNGMRVVDLSARWKIALDDTIDVFPVHTQDARIGWLLGDPIDLPTGKLVNAAITLGTSHSDQSPWEEVCRRFAGSWLFIAIEGANLELRPDASATIGTVYEPQTKRIAAYTYLLTQEDYFSRLNEEGRIANRVDQDGWFTGGMTAHSGISRILPNHSLSTQDFVQRRIPMRMPRYGSDADAVLTDLLSELRVVVNAMKEARPTHIALTGGNETRVLLAAMREDAPKHSFINLQFDGAPLDRFLSKQLTEFCDLKLTILDAIEANPESKKEWLLYAGHAMSGANKDYYPSTQSLAGGVLIGGIGGEVGRGFLWNDGLSADETISIHSIVSRLKLPPTAENLEAVEHWAGSLPDGLDAFQILDLAYLELRLGPWGFAQPRMRVVPRSIHPLLSYNQFQRMWSLAPEMRTSNRMMIRLIELSWPELLQIPINRYGNWRDQWHPIWQAIQRPDKALRKIKQLLGR
ncbi:hypothetical protein [Erythrobacter sp. Alg231-14]|uniref:hypothetical protein n=1 Tax=Erythrobacter sp. Alg231-14 TaxID=1922225 RepID=UPI000D562517